MLLAQPLAAAKLDKDEEGPFALPLQVFDIASMHRVVFDI